MKPTTRHEYKGVRKDYQKKALRLEWLTLIYMSTVVILMYMVLGSSQAMKSAWFEDILSMVPPIMFLISHHFINKAPSPHFPYGYHRVASLSFFVSAFALLCVGLFLIYDSSLKLIERHHPTVGLKEYFGVDMWLGWWMIIVLFWGAIPPVFLGRKKLKLAQELKDKGLYTAAKMNKADWLTAVAAMGGIIGIGFGLWWADAAAALIISADILKDGVSQTKDAITGLINRAPKDLDGNYNDLPETIIKLMEMEPWIKKADVRLHEEGHLRFAGLLKINTFSVQTISAILC